MSLGEGELKVSGRVLLKGEIEVHDVSVFLKKLGGVGEDESEDF